MMFKFPILITEILTDAQYHFEDIDLWREDFKHYFKRKDALYHNHDNETGKTGNTYPLIQYRSYDGQAALYGIQEGALALDKDIKAGIYDFKSRSGQDRTIITKRQYPFELELTDQIYSYSVKNYTPFNPKNHKLWFEMSLNDKVLDIEKRLRFQILNHFCKGVGWKVPGKIELRIVEMRINPKLNRNDLDHYYDNFHFVFQSNLLLPKGIALGKNVAFGYGILLNFQT